MIDETERVVSLLVGRGARLKAHSSALSPPLSPAVVVSLFPLRREGRWNDRGGWGEGGIDCFGGRSLFRGSVGRRKEGREREAREREREWRGNKVPSYASPSSTRTEPTR